MYFFTFPAPFFTPDINDLLLVLKPDVINYFFIVFYVLFFLKLNFFIFFPKRKKKTQTNVHISFVKIKYQHSPGSEKHHKSSSDATSYFWTVWCILWCIFLLCSVWCSELQYLENRMSLSFSFWSEQFYLTSHSYSSSMVLEISEH